MRIACAADLHGHLGFQPPAADLLVLAGDLVPVEVERDIAASWDWAIQRLQPWLLRQTARYKLGVIAIAGNHDFWLDPQLGHDRSYLIETMSWTYIPPMKQCIKGSGHDAAAFFSLPYTLKRGKWAFEATENQIHDALQKERHHVKGIRNVIVSHGPPQGILDRTWDGKEIGSRALLYHMQERKTDLVICGHVHEAAGEELFQSTQVVNCSLIDNRYKFTNSPRVVVLDSW